MPLSACLFKVFRTDSLDTTVTKAIIQKGIMHEATMRYAIEWKKEIMAVGISDWGRREMCFMLSTLDNKQVVI